MWKELDFYGPKAAVRQALLELPSLSEMAQAFDIIGKMLELSSKRACLIIDGLDEFAETSCEAAISFCQELAKPKSIKVLLSSRPLPECVAAFDHFPKLRLEDLNRGDITNYINCEIGTHHYMKRLVQRSPEDAGALLDELVDKSSGVFLWVVLACRSLLSGFSAFDRLSELRSRVNELPSELNDMFQHMLGKIETRHREQGARLLRICFSSTQNARKADKDKVRRDMSTLGLALVGEYDLEPVSIVQLDISERRELCRSMKGRLRSRTAGLLEIVRRDWEGRNAPEECFCTAIEKWDHDRDIDGRVSFLHRTVYEFLCQEHVWQSDRLAISHKRFNTATALSLAGLHLAVQCASPENPSISRAMRYLDEGMAWGRKADAEVPAQKDNIFWHMQPLIDALDARGWQEIRSHIHLWASESVPFRFACCATHETLRLGIQGGAINYVKAWPGVESLAKERSPKCGCAPILSFSGLIQLSVGTRSEELASGSAEMVSLLISLGCDPNAPMRMRQLLYHDGKLGDPSSSLWKSWVTSIDFTRDEDEFDVAGGISEVLTAVKTFQQAGAFPRAKELPKVKLELETLSSRGSGSVASQARALLK